jgi:outer membrane lipoprotein SlyB
MARFVELGLSVAVLCMLGGCGPDYSPNTYSTAAAQQAAKVDRGVVAGFREVAISADGTVGAVTGGAAGGLIGSQAPGGGFSAALGALSGSVIGGIVGTTVEHTTEDTRAFEYIVRQTNGDLISVTQKDKVPLAIGQNVLVIAGKQARVVPDYIVAPVAVAPVAVAPVAKPAEAEKPPAPLAAPTVVAAPDAPIVLAPPPIGSAAPPGSGTEAHPSPIPASAVPDAGGTGK